MSGEWRAWAATASLLIFVGGIALFVTTGNPAVLVIGLLGVVTTLIERSYGQPRNGPAAAMRPTDERFVDPESGKLVTVWLDSSTGERRYVADAKVAE